MKIISETSILEFEFWAGAKENRRRFTYEELEEIGAIIDDLIGEEGITDVQLNDIMWFEPEYFCELLGIDFDEFIEREVN